MTDVERGRGALKDAPDGRDRRWEPTRVVEAKPVTSLRPQMDPAWDQVRTNTCVPHVYTEAFWHKRRRLKLPDWMPSRLFPYWNGRADAYGHAALRADGGISGRDFLKSAAKTGMCREDLFPFTKGHTTSGPGDAAYKDAEAHRVLAYSSLSVARTMESNYTEYDLQAMKACLAGGDPFGMSIVYWDRMRSTPNEQLAVPPKEAWGKVPESHCVLIVGYDDGRQALEFRNSYGGGWGDHGYGWMPYAFAVNPLLAYDMWVIEGVTG